MTDDQLEILQHALGCDGFGVQGSHVRNHYVTDADHPDCAAMVSAGWMTMRRSNLFSEGCAVFYVTEAGKQAMRDASPKSPKLTRSQRRYQSFINSGYSESGGTFGHYIKEVK